jgi:hypothetical protein
MRRSTSSSVAYLTLVLTCFTVAGAEAGVGPLSGAAFSPLAHSSTVLTVQAGECWEQDGPDGPGYYPCGSGSGGGPIVGPAIGLRGRPGVIVAPPRAANSGRVGASGGVSSAHERGVRTSASGAAGVHAAPVSPVLAGVHAPGGATAAHGAPVSASLAGVHAPGGVAAPHVGSPASPGVAGGRVAAPHIGAPASPSLAGVHATGSAAIPHIRAPAAPGLAGVHGVGHR